MKNFRADLKKWVCACIALMPMMATAQTVNVDLSKEYQLIKGFGGINFPTWIDDLSASQRETAFGNDEGQLGLSVLRIHVDPEESNWSKEVATAQNAVKKGVTVFASPWSPPSSMCEPYQSSKRLKTSSYGAYVQHLNKFIDYMKWFRLDVVAFERHGYFHGELRTGHQVQGHGAGVFPIHEEHVRPNPQQLQGARQLGYPRHTPLRYAGEPIQLPALPTEGCGKGALDDGGLLPEQ